MGNEEGAASDEDILADVDNPDKLYGFTAEQFSKLQSLPDANNLQVRVGDRIGYLGKTTNKDFISVNFTTIDNGVATDFLSFIYFVGLRGYKISHGRGDSAAVDNFLKNIDVNPPTQPGGFTFDQ